MARKKKLGPGYVSDLDSLGRDSAGVFGTAHKRKDSVIFIACGRNCSIALTCRCDAKVRIERICVTGHVVLGAGRPSGAGVEEVGLNMRE
jgi:hypothetical protein